MFFKFAQNNYISLAVPVAPLPDISAGDESGFFLLCTSIPLGWMASLNTKLAILSI